MTSGAVFELQNVPALTETPLIDEHDVADAAIQINARHGLFVVTWLQSFQKGSAGTTVEVKGWRHASRMRRAKARESYTNDTGSWIRTILRYVQRTQLEGNCLAIRCRQRRRFDDDLAGFSIIRIRLGTLRKLRGVPRFGGLGDNLRRNENKHRDEKHCGSGFHSLPLSASKPPREQGSSGITSF